MLAVLAMSTLRLLACAAWLAAVGCTNPPSEPAAEPPPPETETETAGPVELPPGDGPVAMVNGAPVPREAFNRVFVQTLERYQRAQHDVKPALRERLKDNIVQRLVEQAIIEQRAKKMEVALDPGEVEASWQQHKSRYGSEEAFTAFLERAGTTAEDVRETFAHNALREALFSRVAAGVEVTDEEIKSFYEENRSRYDEPEMVRASHILLRVPPDATDAMKSAVKAKAETIRAEAVKPKADFGALAREHGEDPTRERGGDLGFFPKGRMVKAFEDAVWKLKPQQVSKVVETQFGFHIVKKLEHKPASRKQLGDVAEQIAAALEAKKKSEAVRNAMAEWRAEAKIEVLLKGDRAILDAVPSAPTVPTLMPPPEVAPGSIRTAPPEAAPVPDR